ncbi:MAG: DUF4388 domain-containing protein [Candidatus Jettenia sp.]|nr:DUF4388 domain-containing protein [Candidatus Jettenia sp.]
MDKKMSLGFVPDHISFSRQVHLTDYLNIIRKRKWVVIVFFLVVVSIVSYISFSTTPVYKATAQIIIEQRSPFVDKITGVMNVDPNNRDDYQTQYNLLMSRSLAKNVIEDLKLWKEFGIDEIQNPNSSTLPVGVSRDSLISSSIDTSASNIPVSGASATPYPTWIVDWYLSKLEIVPLRETHLVYISFLNDSPEKAARIANAHVRAFIARTVQEQHLFSQQAIDWLKAQIRGQKIKVGTSQRAVYEYKYEQLESFSIDDKNIFSLPEIMQSPVIQDLRAKLAELKARKLEMITKYGPKHPKMIEINSSIEKLEQGIIDEVQIVRKTIKAELDRIVALEKIAQQKGAVAYNEKAINYDMLSLDAESDQEMYDILLKQAKEISLTGNMEKNDIRVVDEAEVPLFPVKPKIFLNIFVSAVLGLTFGVGLAFFLEYMDKTVRTPEDIAQRLGLPMLGMIPYDKSLRKGKVLALQGSESHHNQNKLKGIYTQYDVSGSFATRLPLMQAGMSGQVLLIESTTSGEGKTTVLAKSAISLARGGLRVLMVDADVQRPSLHHLFGLKNDEENGLINAMARVLLQEIRQGSLNKYSVSDLFSLLALKKQSGQLVITNDSQTMTAIFENGCLIHIQSQDIPFANRLGTMLLRGGFITESQLKDAIERNQRTGQPLGYILINAGYINQAQLQGPLKLQMEEHLQKLFSWKQGTFVFEPGSVERYEDKRIYFAEDYTSIINRLGRISGSRLLESEVLSHVKPVNEPNLSLLPAGIGDTRPDGPLYFTLLSKFLTLLKQRYDVVLVDAPPLLDFMNSVTPLLSLVDGVIFIVKSGHVSIDYINKATSCIKDAKTNIIGAILNQAKIRHGCYYK